MGDDPKWPDDGGKAFAFAEVVELYSPREIALATGVPEPAVRAALGSRLRDGYVDAGDAVHVGRLLAAHARVKAAAAAPDPIFGAVAGQTGERHPMAALAASGTIHVGLAALIIFVAGLNFAPRAVALTRVDGPADPMRLVFLAIPGPGGGGGGGGLLQPAPAPKAQRQGTRRISSPMPEHREPKPIEPVPPPKPPPLQAEQLPVLVAPIVSAPADPRDRVGVLEKTPQTPAAAESHGPGSGGGAGSGSGTGLGPGDGNGVGPGSGGGTGGGPYRPGSGIQPPRLLREVKADYTEQARQRGLNGEVVLEIVVRRDGSVGDVKILRGLGAGLDERAVQAVRQWRFSPAQRLGSPVDVIVEVAVEFTLR